MEAKIDSLRKDVKEGHFKIHKSLEEKHEESMVQLRELSGGQRDILKELKATHRQHVATYGNTLPHVQAMDTEIKILELLKKGPMSRGQLTRKCGYKDVSKFYMNYLRPMVINGTIVKRKEGKRVFYEVP